MTLTQNIIRLLNSVKWHLTHPFLLRSPGGLAYFLKDIIKDKVVCDVGCRDGYQMKKFGRYAKEVIGIEKESIWCKECLDKGYKIVSGDIFSAPLPEADVYFCWIGAELNKKVFDKFISERKKGVLILGHYSYKKDFFKATDLIFTIPHREGNSEFKIQVIEK